jgi:AmmeMemoRadiSam system protein B
MLTVRPPAVDGLFYPADAADLAALVDGLLAGVPPVAEDGPPIAIVVPHAGYVYSGPIAATAYARLVPWRHMIDRVVLVGPAHRVPVHGIAVPSVGGFATPLGTVPVDREGIERLLGRPGVHVDDAAHRDEHSLEVHLPFLQRVLGDRWSLIPALAGAATAGAVADALSPFWGAESTLVVVSTDLSHYHDLPTARQLDRGTAVAIEAAAWEQLGPEDACGVVPVRGALELSRRRGQLVTLLDLRTSGDTAGPVDRVVGYGSFEIR